MANRWNIPKWLEQEVKARDQACIYCGIRFGSRNAPRKERLSWEHIVNDVRIVTLQNIALCCIGCNASKGAKSLAAWLLSAYCRERAITMDSVAAVARASLEPLSSEVVP